jgi:uncharacterized protein
MDMKTCPRCSETLSVTRMGSVEVEGCSGCGGVWFDHKELTAVAQASTGQLGALEDRFQAGRPAAEHLGTMLCPTCKQALVEFEFKHSPGIKLDGCTQCKGIWVDDGELRAIHDRLTSAPRSEAQPWPAPPGESPPVQPDIRQKARLAVGFLTRVECPGCRQSNPAASPVCWACGTLLQGKRGMLCPRCDRPLTGGVGLGVRMDTCSACGGIWLDAGELATLVRHDMAQLKELQQQIGEVEGLSHMRIEGRDVLICPVCAVGIYGRRAADSAATINTCTHCQGTWLDAGELTLIAEWSRRK